MLLESVLELVRGMQRVSLVFMSTPLISILSELSKSAWSLPYSSRVLPLLGQFNRLA